MPAFCWAVSGRARLDDHRDDQRMCGLRADPTEDTELEEGDEDDLTVDSETGELLDSDIECPLESTAEGEPRCVCPNGIHCIPHLLLSTTLALHA